MSRVLMLMLMLIRPQAQVVSCACGPQVARLIVRVSLHFLAWSLYDPDWLELTESQLNSPARQSTIRHSGASMMAGIQSHVLGSVLKTERCIPRFAIHIPLHTRGMRMVRRLVRAGSEVKDKNVVWANASFLNQAASRCRPSGGPPTWIRALSSPCRGSRIGIRGRCQWGLLGCAELGHQCAVCRVGGGDAHISFTGSPSPAYANDAGDPDPLYSGGTYYTFTTGTVLGNFIQALTDTTGSPTSGWQPYTGGVGSSTLPAPPRGRRQIARLPPASSSMADIG